MPYKDPKKHYDVAKRWRENHQDDYKRITKDYNKLRQVEVFGYCRDLKTKTPCKDCGRLDLYYLMDFDHREGKNNKSPYSCRSLVELNSELEKCDIVCTRCHRIRTFERRDPLTGRQYNVLRGVSAVTE